MGDFIEFDARGIKKMERDMAKWGMVATKDLSGVNRKVATLATDDAKLHAPEGTRSKKDSKSHARPGALKRSMRPSASKFQANISATDRYGHFFLQEFGGLSFWHRGGAGALRALDSKHKGIVGAARAGKVRGHIVYRKAHKGGPGGDPGYFMTSAPIRKAEDIVDTYDEFFQEAWNRTMRGFR